MARSIFFILFLFTSTLNAQNLDSLFQELETTMSKRKHYDERKKTRINNIKKLLSDQDINSENRYFLTSRLILENEYYSFNESLHYINNNIDLATSIGKDSLKTESILKLSNILATSGRYTESLNLLDGINRKVIPNGLLLRFYGNYKKCYDELKNSSEVKRISEKYRGLYRAYSDSLNTEISRNDKESIEYLIVIEQNYRDANKLGEALKINEEILSKSISGTRDFSFAAFNRSYMLRWLNDDKLNQKKYLILSAISDIKGAIKDNASLTNLAEVLFEEGDVERAHKFINFSLEDAQFYNSQLRFLHISNISPQISNSFEARIQKQRNKLQKQLMFISALSIILLMALYFIFKQFQKIKQAREQAKVVNVKLRELNEELKVKNEDLRQIHDELADVGRVKEQYIGSFLNLYSEYIDKLDGYRKMVRKYILTNKVNKLLELTKSKQVIEEELKLFYSNFDKSFLHIYPNFINSVNGLLKPEEQIQIGDNEQLNTELRILALIRLGITNSSKISKILRYSVNTIYNYRVKLRNGAIKRDEFEDLVKNIG
ncbi:DUF6377 domain-containing protein [Seonamhaeicola maritimus]|uniref:Transcriptional regulator n=1 Tax=Seonamhaeicola maritimus TaxID=2591822 RepID=A0A5C7GMF7_9FLAO|nr:DUF6377 domain-containing protein [Seonamhaeicola maritimus]TXG39523.1 transcriptional regulator [Seonamhaeicola maritimus]